MLRDQATDEGADRECEGRDPGPDADRSPALLRRERDGDDRERGRVHQRSAEPLHDACSDQDVRVACESAGKRRECEDDEADHEHQPAAEQVGEFPAREHERAERERVAGDDPFELRNLEVERALHRGERDVHNRVVEHDHEEAEQETATRA